MKPIKVYSTSYCSFCDAAKRLLTRLQIKFEDINLDGKDELRSRLTEENNGYRTVPMIFVGDEFIGGYNELKARADAGELRSQ